MPKKLWLAHLPTPLTRYDALDTLVGAEVWVKRDDMTAGPEAGNKIRKLEYLLADALAKGKGTVVTCGAAQSNHARATALLAASLGLRSVLLLRTEAPASPPPVTGNLLLDRLAGATVRYISFDEYTRRAELLESARAKLEAEGEPAYVIPEGGSNGLGSLGYVGAMQEVREQLDLGLGGGPEPFAAVVHACGSGGTAAGVALGAAQWNVAKETHAIAVCDDRRYFTSVCQRIIGEARALDPGLGEPGPLVIHDAFKGPKYGVASDAQLRFIVEVARRTGLVLDPVYTGKALFGLSHLDPKPKRVLFIHTGGLPGLLAHPEVFGGALNDLH
jgi:D-cysteine desulfhydrase